MSGVKLTAVPLIPPVRRRWVMSFVDGPDPYPSKTMMELTVCPSVILRLSPRNLLALLILSLPLAQMSTVCSPLDDWMAHGSSVANSGKKKYQYDVMAIIVL